MCVPGRVCWYVCSLGGPSTVENTIVYTDKLSELSKYNPLKACIGCVNVNTSLDTIADHHGAFMLAM